MYIDLDRYYNIPMDKILDENTKCVLPTYFDIDFSQDIMISAPQNPIFREAVELNVQRRRQGLNDIYTLGPVSYMHAVTKVLIGRSVNRDPGEEAFGYIREVLATMPFIKTYREQPPNDTVVFKYDEATFKKGNGKSKAQFYEECGVVHWTGVPPT